MANSEVFQAILGQVVEVDTDFGKIELHPPDPEVLTRVHALLDGAAEKAIEDNIRDGLHAYAHALNACLKEPLEVDDAKKIIVLTGNVSGPLCQAVMKLCGLGIKQEEFDENDRPT